MEQMAAGPPVMASTFQAVERKKQGDVREVPPPLEETEQNSHIFSRTFLWQNII